MTEESTKTGSASETGGLSLRGFFLAGIRLANNRLQILSTEVAEERVRLSLAALTGVAGLFFLGLAVVLGVMLLVVLFWDEHRVALLSVLASVFGFLGAFLLTVTAKSINSKERPFKVTIDELKKDEDAWRTGQSND